MKPPVKIGITLGDINGIGPEVTLKAVYQHRWPANIRFILIGNDRVLGEQAKKGKHPVPAYGSLEESYGADEKVVCWHPSPRRRLNWRPGLIQKQASCAAAQWIETAAQKCLTGDLDGMVTAPISKEGFHRAGINVPGHTEYLAGLTETKRFAMMLIGGPLRVALVTRHLPLRRVAAELTQEHVLETLTLTAESLPWLGCVKGCVGVCGFNPHAGDGGTIGREEIDIITPAVRAAQKKRLRVEGPLPADTIFYKARRGRFAAVVAMYHDQGLGPLKMIAFDKGVNVTLGLPIVRTSPDHGTAFDIAGKNRADPSSMVEGIKMAYQLAKRKNPWKKQFKTKNE